MNAVSCAAAYVGEIGAHEVTRAALRETEIDRDRWVARNRVLEQKLADVRRIL